MNNKTGFTVVYNVQGELSAHMVKLFLESRNIPSMMLSETYFNLYLGFQAPYSIIVPSHYVRKARKLLEKQDFNLVYTVPKKKLWPYLILRVLSYLIAGR